MGLIQNGKFSLSWISPEREGQGGFHPVLGRLRQEDHCKFG